MRTQDQKKHRLQTQKFAEKKRHKKILKIAVLFAILCVIIFTLSRISSLSYFKIDTVEIVGADQEIASTTRSIVLDSIQGKYLGLFSKSDIFLYPKTSLIDKIRKSSAEIEDVSIKRNGFKSLLVNVVDRVPFSIICTSVPDDITNGDNNSCLFADKKGLVFKKSDSIIESLPRIFIQESTTTDVIGSTPIDKDRYLGLINFYNKILGAKISVFGLLLSDTHNELYIGNNGVQKDNSDDLAVVYFSEKYPVDETMTNFLSFWDHMKSDKVSHSFSEIKLQFPPNIYYTETK